MKRVIGVPLLFFPMVLLAADLGSKVPALPLDRCQFREVISIMSAESDIRSGAIAEQTLPVLNQLKYLSSRGKNPTAPLQNQLSSDELIRFSELSHQLRTIQLASLIESYHQRDLMVIERMAMLADREYRWHDYPGESDPDFIIYESLQVLRLVLEPSDDSITTPSVPHCTLERTLHSIQLEPIAKLNAYQLEDASRSVNAILGKYGLKKIDPSRLSNEDLEKVTELKRSVITPAKIAATFILDIEHIKLMASAAELMYEGNKQDIAFGGGDINAIGITLNRRRKNNEIDNKTWIALHLWTRISEKLPSEVSKRWTEISKQMKEIENSDNAEKQLK